MKVKLIKKISFILLLSSVLFSQKITSGYLATTFGNNKISLYNTSTWKKEAQITGDAHERFYSVAFHPDRKHLVSGGDGQIKIWVICEGESGVMLQDVKTINCGGSSSYVKELLFSSQGQYLVARDIHDNVRIFDASKWEQIETPGMCAVEASLTFSSNGSYFALAWLGNVEIFETGSWKKINTLKQGSSCYNREVIHSISFGRDFILATGYGNGVIKLWDMQNPEEPKQVKSLGGYDCVVNALAFSKFGGLASGSVNGEIKLWDISQWKLMGVVKHRENDFAIGYAGGRTVMAGCICKLEFSPDSKTLVSGAGAGDTTIKLWDTSNWKSFKTIEAENKNTDGIDFAFMPEEEKDADFQERTKDIQNKKFNDVKFDTMWGQDFRIKMGWGQKINVAKLFLI